ncbi:ZFY16 protein, partial [Galbula dea]|nr:ZFY16 protein [Galbula dea]
VTGASYVMFKEALNITSGLAKPTVVEDGLLVEITPETMKSLRQALRDKKDFTILCEGNVAQHVEIYWVDNEEETNKG